MPLSVHITDVILFCAIVLRLLGRRAAEFHSAAAALDAAGMPSSSLCSWDSQGGQYLIYLYFPQFMTLPHFFLVLKFILRQENALRNATAQQRAAGPATPAVVCPARPAILQYLLRPRAPPANAPPANPPAPPANLPAPPANPPAPRVRARVPVAAPAVVAASPARVVAAAPALAAAAAGPGRLEYDSDGSYYNLISDGSGSGDDGDSDGAADSDIDVTMAAWNRL